MKNLRNFALSIALTGIVFMAVPAQAAFFENSSTWSFDSLYQSIKSTSSRSDLPAIQTSAVASSNSPISKPVSKAVAKTYTVSASAYSSSVDETDDTPFITAKGTYVRDGIVAANFLPFGTAIKIPEVFGDKIFIVEDRMNKRYRYNVDVWFPSKELAKQFGRKTVRIEVIS
ncbi:MAG: hypothetical protein A2669_01810 [Candidatus Yanofskybacteria bacterium RIFCSPHIGHO2_01_FULL_48_25b]|uniref:3D domain-containing protein n=1 Tax=Candidatus Yanofskybacteria bacterium RIFCSPHIGHO2_01_FULL_48_25b TaxID=1802672 RepID=A0A1F8F349_9BACT|nr:MAG: hypothetical protein A2669_01810 [Candidatus Yanofskybacteria bacterium RIFCSPHIGHO2_01_FULL_48_25b]